MMLPTLFGPVKYLVEGLIDCSAALTLVVMVVASNGGADDKALQLYSVLVIVTVLGVRSEGVKVIVVKSVMAETNVVVAVEALMLPWTVAEES